VPERRLADGRNQLDVVAHTYTDQRGAYRVAHLRAGTYYTEAERPPSGMPPDDQGTEHATYYGGALDFSGAKPIEAAAGRTISGIDIEIQKRTGVRISGRIVPPAPPEGGASSEPMFTMVSLQSASGDAGNIEHFTATRSDTFEIKDVLPGKYTLSAVTRETYGRPESARERAAAIETVEVDQAGLSGLTITLQPHTISPVS